MIDTKSLAAASKQMMVVMNRHMDNPDVQYLLSNSRFMKLLEDAVEMRISQPVVLGLERWALESNIRSCEDVNSVLTVLYFLFRGEQVPV